jgi:glycosyltransferase involved in cell wall biosynthesis
LTAPRKLSVILPCLDAAATLPPLLDALAAQRWDGEWEVVVADNGSTDASRQIVERYRDRLPGLRWIDASARRGQAHARNAGAAAATGDALLFLDCDDEPAPGWLAGMARALASHDFVACRYDQEKLNPRWLARSRATPQALGPDVYGYPPFLPHAGGSSLGVKRAVHEQVGGFDVAMTALEDTDYCWRIQLAGTPLAAAPDALVHIRMRSDLGGIFRQALFHGEWNVAIYRRYRDRGMPKLPLGAGLARWAKLVLTAPKLVLGRSARTGWIQQLGWRLGRLRGSLRYRVLAP